MSFSLSLSSLVSSLFIYLELVAALPTIFATSEVKTLVSDSIITMSYETATVPGSTNQVNVRLLLAAKEAVTRVELSLVESLNVRRERAAGSDAATVAAEISAGKGVQVCRPL